MIQCFYNVVCDLAYCAILFPFINTNLFSLPINTSKSIELPVLKCMKKERICNDFVKKIEGLYCCLNLVLSSSSIEIAKLQQENTFK